MKQIPVAVLPLFLGSLSLGAALPGQQSSPRPSPSERAKQREAILRLAKTSQAKQSFRRLQSVLLLLEEGMEREGLDLLGRFYMDRTETLLPGTLPSTTPANKLLIRVEERAIQTLLHPKGAMTSPVRIARALLVGLRPAKGNPRRVAINRLTPRALALLLEQEANPKALAEVSARAPKKETKGRSPRPVLALLKRHAADGLKLQKRAARRSLLMGDPEARRSCYKLALRYPRGPQRSDILNLVKARGLAAEAVPTIGLGFSSKYPLLHTRSARALRELGAKEAMPLLRKESFHLAKVLAKLREGGNGGAGPRANISLIKQQTIVRDYEVQVAQGAAVADPVVDVVSEGVVLDVKVLGVSIIRHLLLAKREVDKAYHALKRGTPKR
ncbi:MAG TPA: hypothetical protein ENK02_14410 [Planctomycetes bacterium]|nr:hypothetical protein [Planctomycetota bacterium]